ncbi:M12 family metallo-peptidase [Thalassotalea psychrophila]|uniref:M12 family metallo-peptidase n=1 Tax=Thalassotalea psychrophila TaxID=3065647 RepID=A0ABY9TY85_9GAMM|nr:M12 family metallo-peptidase [Colwelliaceae bacterium SQ149]
MTLSKLLKNVALLFTYLLYACVGVAYASQSIWQDVSSSPIEQDNFASKKVSVNQSRLLELNISLIKNKLQQAQKNITLPMPDGSMVEFRFTESDVLPVSLAAKYPNIKTYQGVQVDNKNNYGRFDYTEQGFHGVINYNNKTIYIDPEQNFRQNLNSIENDNSVTNLESKRKVNKQYKSYYKKDVVSTTSAIESQVLKVAKAQPLMAQKSNATQAINKVYRIAFAATGEYSQFHGGSKATVLSAITTLVNRLNQVFEVELGIKLQLAEHSDDVIYLDSASDPYVNTYQDVYNNPQVLRETLGINNFDIGHVLSTGGGGLAVVAATCDNDAYVEDEQEYYPIKAMGVTGSERPVSDSFYIDFVAHELGHQLGAEHSFNGQSGYCSGGNRVFLSAYEPGSGSTIMSYAGLCGSESQAIDGENLQASADDYFHIHSIEQMSEYLTADPWQIGQSCGKTFATTNNAPTVDAGRDYVIPAQTPFELTASGSDSDFDELTFTFEQFDLGSASNNIETMQDDGLKPLFRSNKPSHEASRIFPNMDSVLSGSLVIGESYATTNRELNFKVTVRDNKGGIAVDAVKLQVLKNSTPFQILSPNANELWFKTATSTISWDVANTQNDEINCQYVNIDLSGDGGQHFNTRLASKVDNNGEFDVATPKINTSTARVKISCVDNIFFAVSVNTFAINNNFSPVASSDHFEVSFESQNHLDVLNNDTDENLNDELTLVSITYQGRGDVSISSNQISYTPAAGFSGSESLSYQIHDEQGNIVTANVTIDVLAPDRKGAGATGQTGFVIFIFFILIIRKNFIFTTFINNFNNNNNRRALNT